MNISDFPVNQNKIVIINLTIIKNKFVLFQNKPLISQSEKKIQGKLNVYSHIGIVIRIKLRNIKYI